MSTAQTIIQLLAGIVVIVSALVGALAVLSVRARRWLQTVLGIRSHDEQLKAIRQEQAEMHDELCQFREEARGDLASTRAQQVAVALAVVEGVNGDEQDLLINRMVRELPEDADVTDYLEDTDYVVRGG